jgi:hypothetical protein
MQKQEQRRGRKLVEPDQRMIQRVVTFDNQTAMKLSRLGDGNMSLGIRRATELAFERLLQNEAAIEKLLDERDGTMLNRPEVSQ